MTIFNISLDQNFVFQTGDIPSSSATTTDPYQLFVCFLLNLLGWSLTNKSTALLMDRSQSESYKQDRRSSPSQYTEAHDDESVLGVFQLTQSQGTCLWTTVRLWHHFDSSN